MTCETCAHYLSEKVEDGDCTRFPPVTVVITNIIPLSREVRQVPTSFFPRVRKDQGRGEWVSKIRQ